MKPNDKAIEAAREEYYAALIRALRSGLVYNVKNNRAADAIEALLAERDALKAELIDYKDAAASEADFVNEQAEKIRELNVEIDKWESAYKEITDTRVKIEETTVDKLKKVESERDALLARFAPVEDEALVEIAATAYLETHSDKITPVRIEAVSPYIRAAIAAIRPHIEAAERERCAKIAEGSFLFDIETWLNSTKKEMTAHVAKAIAAAIRSGK